MQSQPGTCWAEREAGEAQPAAVVAWQLPPQLQASEAVPVAAASAGGQQLWLWGGAVEAAVSAAGHASDAAFAAESFAAVGWQSVGLKVAPSAAVEVARASAHAQ